MSIEFEPAWIGTIVLDGYVMRAWKMEKVWENKKNILIMSRGEHARAKRTGYLFRDLFW